MSALNPSGHDQTGHDHSWSSVGRDLYRCCLCDVLGYKVDVSEPDVPAYGTRRYAIAVLGCHTCGDPAAHWFADLTVGNPENRDVRARCATHLLWAP